MTGKGGTGKSTVAAALALKHAREGKRVLLIELGNRSFFSTSNGSSLANAASPSEQVRLPDALAGIDLLQLAPLASLKQFVKRFALFETAANMLLDSKPARGVLNTLPGLKELAIIGKLTHYLEPSDEQGGYDLVVVDSFSTGHFLALLRAPLALAESIRSGPMGRQCRKMIKQLQDPTLCRFVIVTLPEELPLAESLELSATLADEFAIEVDYLCNKTLLEQDLIAVDAEAADQGFVAYLEDWRQRQTKVLAVLTQQQRSVQALPYCFEVDLNQQIETLADALT
ncbi:MAG: ArsA family ATPase [Halopseudomonas sp.]